ncbi:hypothetical protein TIFTF001_051212 [Ficus carica]|uniref:Uncharacterized protein n=1 Tax=Ficus carica TaxID=3494 RepID=A0AA87YT73_FICCA|nr:hypothetical protein TIFTF001_051212 [Ficus carica]
MERVAGPTALKIVHWVHIVVSFLIVVAVFVEVALLEQILCHLEDGFQMAWKRFVTLFLSGGCTLF